MSDLKTLGLVVVADACVDALMNEPTEEVLVRVSEAAASLGVEPASGPRPGRELTQRYYDRLFVPSAAAHIPLFEDSICGGGPDADAPGGFRYGVVTGRAHDHVVACYRTAGFDFHEIEGYELSRKTLRPTSMAAELAFVSALLREACKAAEAGEGPRAERACELAREFARQHPARWFSRAASCLRRFDDDLYARVADLAALVVEDVADR